jgi:hypothetical protein
MMSEKGFRPFPFLVDIFYFYLISGLPTWVLGFREQLAIRRGIIVIIGLVGLGSLGSLGGLLVVIGLHGCMETAGAWLVAMVA